MGEKLGQHFLENKEIVSKIIKAAELKPSDVVIEIGPGKGILTEELAKQAGKVIAVELDKVLSKVLSNTFSNKKNVEVINKDILKLITSDLQIETYKVVANLPYYIISPVIRKFLEDKNPPSEMILMVQKEVAERIVSGPGKMSILSISVQYYAKPEILFYVGKENFNPVPKVDSAVIKITHRLRSGQAKKQVNNFFRIVKAGFCAKRKTLINNLSNSLHLDKKEVEEKLKKVPLSGTTRAQELSVEDWEKVSELF